MELISLSNIPKEAKIKLLAELGFNSDGTYVLDTEGNKIIDKYIQEPVTLNNMLILPGSIVIIDNNPVSINLYLEEYGDAL